MLARLTILALLPVSLAAEDTKAWPPKFEAPAAKVIKATPPEGTAFAYETAHFRLLADREIKPAQLTSFATVIESVPLLLESLPLPLWAPPDGDKPRVILYHDSLDYHSAGGSVGSSGFYDGRRQRVLIRADVFLNPPTLKPTRLRPKPNEDLLVHELAHLGMHNILSRTKPWLSEGLAEYLAAAHVGKGVYDFTQMDRAIRDHIRRHLTPDADNVLSLPALQHLLNTSGKQWRESNRRSDERLVYRPYAASLLLAHYHLHGKERRSALDRHLRKLLAHRDRRTPFPLLDAGPPTDIEARLTQYWGPKGLTLHFEKP